MTTTPQLNVGDIVRRKESNRNNETYLVGTQPFKVKRIEPGYRLDPGYIVDEHGKQHFPGSLELVEPAKPSPSVELSEHGKKLLEEIRAALKVPAVQIEDIKQVAALGEQMGVKQPESVFDLLEGAQQTPRSGFQEHADGTLTHLGEMKRDRLIAHINDLDAVIRRRNQTIERQNAQLAEYAAELEMSRSYAEALNGYGIETFMDGMNLVELGTAARQLAIDTPEKLVQLVKAADWTPGKPLRSPAGADEYYDPHVVTPGEQAAIRALQKRIGEANAAKGFHAEGDDLRSRLHGADVPGYLRNYYTARLALITTEVAEAIEEIRHGRQVDETYYPTATDEDNARNIRDGLTPAELNLKPEGVPSELADVVIRSFDFADEAGIDLAAMIDEKISYNQTREHKHGKEF